MRTKLSENDLIVFKNATHVSWLQTIPHHLAGIRLFFILTSLLILSCQGDNPGKKAGKTRAEIIKTEQAFASMAKKEGVAKAFLFFAADDAVLNRNDSLIRGIENIRQYFKDHPYENATLEWAPDFVGVSESGDLAYTYGHYQYHGQGKNGKSVEATGVFHTVWKKQPDGSWRFVWD